MQCFKCDQDAVQECPRCGALYCDDHGGVLCDRCMDPVLAVPSYRVFRGSLAALLVGSVVAVWLLVLPPSASDKDQPPSSIAGVVQTATARPSGTASPGGTASGTGTPTATRSGSATPTASGTAATSTPTTTPTPTATASTTSYTVKQGDTLTSIADQFKTTPDAIQKANNISDPTSMQVGQVLTIPR